MSDKFDYWDKTVDPAYDKYVEELFSAALEAVEMFGEDELEEFARTYNEKPRQ